MDEVKFKTGWLSEEGIKAKEQFLMRNAMAGPRVVRSSDETKSSDDRKRQSPKKSETK